MNFLSEPGSSGISRVAMIDQSFLGCCGWLRDWDIQHRTKSRSYLPQSYSFTSFMSSISPLNISSLAETDFWKSVSRPIRVSLYFSGRVIETNWPGFSPFFLRISCTSRSRSRYSPSRFNSGVIFVSSENSSPITTSGNLVQSNTLFFRYFFS